MDIFLGQNITAIRKKFNYNKKEFEQFMECPRGQMGKYEDNLTRPSIDFLLKLEEISGVPIYAMFYKLINPLQLPHAPLELKDHSLIDESEVYYGKEKTESEELSELKDKIIKLLEENRDLRKRIEGLNDWIAQEKEIRKRGE